MSDNPPGEADAVERRLVMWLWVQHLRDRMLPGNPNPLGNATEARMLLDAMLDLNNRLTWLENEVQNK